MFRLLSHQLVQRRAFSTTITPMKSGLDKFPPIVFVLGGPGSGKGTQCERLLAAANLTQEPSHLPSYIYHVNVGGLLREAQQEYRMKMASREDFSESHLAKAGPVLEEMMSTGNILPSWVTVTILKNHLERIADEVATGKFNVDGRPTPAILIDGFPRSEENFVEFERLIGPARRLVVVDVDDDAMVNRVLKRGENSGRADDQSIDTIRNRLRVFSEETGAVINKFSIFDVDAVEITATRTAIKVDGNRAPADVSVDFAKAFLRLVKM